MRLGRLAILGVVVLFFYEGNGQAEPCTSDEDCPKGEVCVVKGCPPCDPEGVCAPCDEFGECVPERFAGYGAKECDSDSDCPLGFKCEETVIPCEEGRPTDTCVCVCPEDGACEPCQCPKDASAWEPCEPKVTKVCTFKPKDCSSDSDCDEGFECRPEEVCYGEGCSCPRCECAPCPPDGLCEPCDCPDISCDCPDTFEPQCEVLGHWCAPKEVPCKEDSDCLEGWECVEIGPLCKCPPCECIPPPCADGLECPDVGDDACICEPCDCPQEGKLVCLPKGWKEAGYVGGDSPEVAFGGTPKGGGEGSFIEDATTTQGSDAFATQDLGVSAPSKSSSSSGCSTGASLPLGTFLTLSFFALFLLCFRLVRR